jgi:hypothetical protein
MHPFELGFEKFCAEVDKRTAKIGIDLVYGDLDSPVLRKQKAEVQGLIKARELLLSILRKCPGVDAVAMHRLENPDLPPDLDADLNIS